MVKERMDLLELLRKGGMDGDVDFLREALRVLVEGIRSAMVLPPRNSPTLSSDTRRVPHTPHCLSKPLRGTLFFARGPRT